MILFPNCKINLGLHILQKRADGFHDLETVFYPIALQDALEVIHGEASSAIQFTSSGIQLDVSASDNICVKAYQLLKADFPDLPAIKMHLHKTIPSGAGLGGGSADGAFTLLLLNKKFHLQLSEQQLINYALQLGSDCPFFIKNQPCYATGRGELLEPIHLPLSDYQFVIVNPGIHINTGWAFKQLNPRTDRASLKELIQQPLHKWKEVLVNDFEAPIFQAYPEIENIQKELYTSGAHYAAMSGSGSTVFGIFEKNITPVVSFPEHYFVRTLINSQLQQFI
jgi:4-diphosphocytidyl-2-C-methyl-D-erythritol kinase